MATTTIHSIHRRPLRTRQESIRRSLAYDMNYKKTDNGKLIATINCSAATAADEIILRQEIYRKTTGREVDYTTSKKNKGAILYKLYQSFDPKDNEHLTPELANKIGVKTIQRLLGNDFSKYQIVVCTHIDKRHIHNHISFNSVSSDMKKYYISKYTYKELRRISDYYCQENNLHIIENPKPATNRRYTKSRPISYRQEIKNSIAELLPQAKSFDDLLRLLSANGYQINRDRKYITILSKDNGQERPIRLNSLGNFYSKESIEKRLTAGKVFKRNRRRITRKQKLLAKAYPRCKNVRVAKNNITAMLNAMRLMESLNVKGYAELVNEINTCQEQIEKIEGKCKEIDLKINKAKMLGNAKEILKENEVYYNEYLNQKNRSEESEGKVEDYLAAKRLIEKYGNVNVEELELEYAALKESIFASKSLKEKIDYSLKVLDNLASNATFLTPYQKTEEQNISLKKERK